MSDQDKDQPVKLTVTFAGGHTKSYDTFISVVADGLIAAGKHEGRVYYNALEEGFCCYSFCAIAASPAVIAGLLKGIAVIVDNIVDGMDPIIALEFVSALLNIDAKEIELYSKKETVRKRTDTN